VVEHSFGWLKGRWCCLLKINDTSVKYIVNQIAACCVLHNLCEMQQEDFLECWRIDPVHNDQVVEANEVIPVPEEAAFAIRNVLKNMLHRERVYRTSIFNI
jgi:hypothetical protein